MACVSALDGHLRSAAIYIAVAAVFDLLDGMVARALGVSGPLGKQLDSLADMVSFGVAPALIARESILKALYMNTGEIAIQGLERLLPFLPLVLVACSALRLARFNLDDSQAVDFKGLPTPANALFWISIPFSTSTSGWLLLQDLLQNPYVLGGLCIVMSLLLVSSTRLLSMKIDRQDVIRSRWQFVLIIGGAILFSLFRFAALPFIIVLYLLLSLIRNTTLKHEIQS